MNRYARQMILPEVGQTGQDLLTAAHVLLVGAGGLGCPALQYLAGAGIGRITVVDPDRVSQSNLHRQILYRETDIGAFKAKAAQKTLQGLNADCRILPVSKPISPCNAADLVSGATVVLDCADSFAASYILSDQCLAQGVPLISASALGMTGYVGGFCGGAPSLRALFPDLPHQMASCDTAGVLGPVVGAIGALQAQMALSVVLNLSPSPLGQLQSLDLQSFRSGGFCFKGAAEPQNPLRFISPDAVTDTDFTVDLRGLVEAPDPAHTGAQTPAKRYVVDDFDSRKPRPDPSQRAVLICRSGLRAWQAAMKLRSYWTGDIVLIALGTTPDTERQN